MECGGWSAEVECMVNAKSRILMRVPWPLQNLTQRCTSIKLSRTWFELRFVSEHWQI
jgi:hypothetical protein